MKLTGAEIIIKVLLEQGVDTVFGYPGGNVLNIYDELYKYQDRITHYTTCHEQGAAHAADGYARATGKPGVVIATSGPGATNLVTGIACAYFDSTPMVAVTGNVPSGLLGRDSFQEVDIAGITMPVTKHNYIAKDIDRLADILREAFQVAISGRPGPVLVDVPKDVQLATTEYEAMPMQVPRPDHPVDMQELEQALEVIRQSKRPFIYCGGGIVLADASEELQKLAELIDAPIGSSMMGLSSVPTCNPCFLGMTGMHGRFASTKAQSECDLLIAVGARFSDRATGDKVRFSQGRIVLHIDIDPAEISKNITVDKCVIGNLKEVLQTLCERLEPVEHPEWREWVESMKNCPQNDITMPYEGLTPQHAIEAVSDMMTEDDLMATDVGQHQMWVMQYGRFCKPRTLLTSGGLGAMGFGMGASIGGSLSRNRQRVVLFTSDGSFHMNLNELATAVSHDIPLIVVVLNNGVLGMVRQWQTLFYEERYSCTSLHRKTDFVKLAESFGAVGMRATTKQEFDTCIQEAFTHRTPVVIDCQINSDIKVLPMIPPNKSINDIILK